MKPKLEINKRKMVLDLNSQKSKLDNKDENISKIRNKIFQIISSREQNLKLLEDLNELLKSQQNPSYILNYWDKKIDGTFLHYLTLNSQAGDEVSWRMVYALSNAGINANIQDSKGNTALHLAYMRGYAEIGFNFIEALLKISPDFRIKNKNGKVAMEYMEDLEQLRCMYEAHYPGVWVAAERSDINIFYRLINSFVKINTFNNGTKLSDYVKDKCNRNSENILEIIEKYGQIIDFVHSIYAVDFKLMKSMTSIINENFDSNIADFSYCFSWYKPFCRNIPKFVLEIAIESEQIDIVNFLITNGSDVNLPNSKSGKPIYFCAFSPQFVQIKNDILSRANFNAKNHNGQSVLFYLVDLYLNENTEHKNELLTSFVEILNRYPMLLTHRDANESTLIEEILSKNPKDFKKSLIFLKQISNFILGLLETRNFKVFKEMFYQSYGLVLLNTPIYLSNNHDFVFIPFEDFVETHNKQDIKIYLRKLLDNNFVINLNNFITAICNGDLNFIKNLFKIEKNISLLRIRDYSGRSCLHLACLYGQSHIVKYLLQHDPKLIKSIDNSNRTALHYAYGIKNQEITKILLSYNINKFARDSKFLLAEEYELEEVLDDDWFGVRSFKNNQTNNSRAIELFMMCFQFEKFKIAIKDNNIDQLKILCKKLMIYNLSIIDFPLYMPNLQNYHESITLLEIAVRYKHYSAFRYLLEQYYENFKCVDNNVSKLKKKKFDLYLNNLRERAEILELFEIIDIIDNTIEDEEIAEITLSKIDNLPDNRLLIQNILKKNVNNSNKLFIMSKLDEIEKEVDFDPVLKETKVCSIL